LLVPTSLIPYWIGATGVTSAIVTVLLGLGYVALSWMFMRRHDRKSALSLMFYSFIYIPLTLIALFADKI